MMRHIRVHRVRAVQAAIVLALFALPAVVMAHAELVVSAPADGEKIVGQPAGRLINARYTEDLDPAGSSLKLVDANGATIATGGVASSGDYPREMWIEDLPTLAPGAYTVKSTTKSIEDGDIDHSTWTFTIVAPSGSATQEPTPICTDGCDGQSSGGPVTNPTPTVSPGATPTPSADSGTTGSGIDVLLPIIAAVVIVGVIAGFLFSGRDRPPTGT